MFLISFKTLSMDKFRKQNDPKRDISSSRAQETCTAPMLVSQCTPMAI